MALPAPLKLSDVRQPRRHFRLRHYVRRRDLIGGRWSKQVVVLDELLVLGVASMNTRRIRYEFVLESS